MISSIISYHVTENVFIKRQLHINELGDDKYGNAVVNPCSADRLRNEGAVLRHLRGRTAIPVPELLNLQAEMV